MIPSNTAYSQEINEFMTLPLLELITLANQSRAEVFDSTLELCTIVNAKSGLCNQDCAFCAQSSRHRTNTPTYPLQSETQVMEAALRAEELGATRFGIVTSGHSPNPVELEQIAETVAKLGNRTGLKLCASLGGLAETDLKILRQAGLSRYHHNIETSAAYYPQICTTHSFEDRLATISYAKEAGLEVCSGGIIGLGETWQDRIAMALTLKELAVDAVPLNILMPIPGTRLSGASPLSVTEIIRTIAIFRLILKQQIIKIAAGRESMLKDFQGLSFLAGANGMLIGGYLTVKGRPEADDQKLIRDILNAWRNPEREFLR